jgi:hypothetical protein
MILDGIGAWYNQFGWLSLDKMVERARSLPLPYITIKYGYPGVERAFAAAGIPWGTERFVYPDQPVEEATMLANAIDAGGRFAVVNAEDWAGWAETDITPMRTLLDVLFYRHPDLQVFASIDSRGDRNNLPFQHELISRCTAVLPMIYPLAFYQSRPPLYVRAAFSTCLDGKDFLGKPVYPTIQTYDGIGTPAVAQEIAEVRYRGLPGYNIYTLGHATDDEWAEVVKDFAAHRPVPPVDHELDLRRAYMGMAGRLDAFDQSSLQDVVNTAAAYLGTRPTA